MTTTIISSGQSYNGLNVTSGDTLEVLSGGSVNEVDLLNGGTVILDSGAVMTELQMSGGVVSGAGVLAGAYHNGNFVYGGVVSGVTLEDYGGYGDLSIEGGSAEDVTIDGQAYQQTLMEVASGASATGTIVHTGYLQVDGSASGSVVEEGGGLYVDAGTDFADSVRSGGVEVVSQAGVLSGATIQAGGLLELAGAATGVIVESGGAFAAGGDIRGDRTVGAVTSTTVVSGATLSSGAFLDLYGAEVQSGAVVSLASGALAIALTVSKGAVVDGPGEVGGGYTGYDPNAGPNETSVAGEISGVTLGDSGAGDDSSIRVLSGGAAYAVKVIESNIVVSAGGTASGTTLSGEPAELFVYGSATGALIGSGAFEFAESGGVASDDTVQSGGALYLEGTGVVSGETVQSGGMADFQGDLTRDFTLAVSGSSGIAPGTTALDGVTVSTGGYLIIGGSTLVSGVTGSLGSDSITSYLTVAAGARLFGPGELAQGYVYGVISGVAFGEDAERYDGEGVLEIESGGRAANVSVFGDGEVLVDSGATASDTLLQSGYTGSSTALIVDSGVTVGTRLQSRTQEIVEHGAVASGTVVSTGGVEFDFGSAVGTTVSNGGVASAYGVAAAYGVASGATILAGGSLVVGSHGEDEAAMVAGKEYVEEFGLASGTTVLSGGRSYDLALASATATLLSSGGVQYVYGVASGTTVLAGGDESIESGGTGEAARLAGKEDVEAGGVTSGTTISGGGVVNVLGVEDLATVSNGGEEVVRGGAVSGTTVLSGGVEYVLSGTADATTISSGGRAAVKSGAETDATVDGGASLTVSAGGTVSGTLTLAGGTATVFGAVAAGATVAFSGSGGLLVLDDTSAFEGDISGLADASQKVELAGFAYSTSETVSFTEAASNTSGVLTVHDGVLTAALTLVGSYATGDFTLAKGPGGSTYVYDPPPAAPVAGAAQMVHAIAVFTGSAAPASDAALHAMGVDHLMAWDRGRSDMTFPVVAHAPSVPAG